MSAQGSSASAQRKHAPNHSASRTVAALIGTVPASLLLGIALTLVLPLPLTERYVIGWYSVAPSWVMMSCCVFLAASAKRAWLIVSTMILLSASVSAIAIGCGRAPGLQVPR